MGSKGGNSNSLIGLQISGASFIGSLLQSTLRRCYLTVVPPPGRLLLSISRMARRYAKITVKLGMRSIAILLDIGTCFTPLKLAACMHLAKAYMHRDVCTYYCESNHCGVSAVNAPCAQEIATTALALLIVILSIIGWHVPRGVRSQRRLCRILTAMSMQALQMNLACTAMAFLLPTFGKRPQEEGGTARKRTTARSPATEQTPKTPTRPATEHMLGTPTESKVRESTATEHASAEFCIEDAMAETLRRIKAIPGESEILVRVIDHACSSEQCVSHRVVAMCREAKWKMFKDLRNDQAVDACGYIAADAVCRLREAALAEANAWHRTKLPDYARLECIDRGNQVLHKSDPDRILDSDQVNRLVRHYSNVDQRSQAAEEWWAGAVAIDHFLRGLPNTVSELAANTSVEQHRWRAWIVNTQSSTQRGSHWFTVVVAAVVEDSSQLLQSTAASKSTGSAVEAQLLQSTATSKSRGSAVEPNQPPQRIDRRGDPSTNNYPNLFKAIDPVMSNALDWAHANTTHPDVRKWRRVCSQWDSVVATKGHEKEDKRRKLCMVHDIPIEENICESNGEVETAMVYIRNHLTDRIKKIHVQYTQENIGNHFKRLATDEARAETKELQTPEVATDVRSTHSRLHAQRHIYAEDQDFHIVKDALSKLRGYVNKNSYTK